MVKRGRASKSDNTLWVLGAVAVAAVVGFYIYRQAAEGVKAVGTGKSGVAAKCVGADWCGYSKKQMAEMDTIKAKVGGKATVEYHDAATDQGKKLVADNKIAGFPTCIVHKNGSKVGEWSGFAKADDFLKKLESYL